MDERLKSVLRAVVPKRLLEPIVRRYLRICWVGDYPTWAQAARRARGYADAGIFARVLEATRQVRDGKAAFERDGLIFTEPTVSPDLARALVAAIPEDGRLSVLDFGGALGSVYWQLRSWLDALATVRWSVVEQPHFVAAGRREFTSDRLRFYASIDECLGHERPGVLLLGGVLPYLPEPHALLADVAGRSFDHVLIDRTGIIDRAADRLTVQHLPRRVYRASYPCWFFNRTRLLQHFNPAYELIHEYRNEDGAGSGFVFQGFHLRRRVANRAPRS